MEHADVNPIVRHALRLLLLFVAVALTPRCCFITAVVFHHVQLTHLCLRPIVLSVLKIVFSVETLFPVSNVAQDTLFTNRHAMEIVTPFHINTTPLIAHASCAHLAVTVVVETCAHHVWMDM